MILLCITILPGCWKSQSEWMQEIQNIMSQEKQGLLEAKDARGNSVTLEWYFFDVLSPAYESVMKSISNTVVDAFTTVELQRVKMHPESLKDQFEFLADLFENGIENVNWKIAAERMQTKIKNIIEIDYSSIFDSNNICILVIAYDKNTRQQLGVVQFLINPSLDYGDVNVPVLGIIPEAQGRGLGKLLLSSIFKIVPTVKGIILSTRVTNEKAINAYKAWGFIDYPEWTNPEKGWVGFEYRTNLSDILQKRAEQIVF